MKVFAHYPARDAALAAKSGVEKLETRDVLCHSPSMPTGVSAAQIAEIMMEVPGQDLERFRVRPMDRPAGFDFFRIPVAELAAVAVTVL